MKNKEIEKYINECFELAQQYEQDVFDGKIIVSE